MRFSPFAIAAWRRYKPPHRITVDQARRYWDLGFASVLGYLTFASFLSDVPEIPKRLQRRDQRFPHLLLVLPCIEPLTLNKLCEVARVDTGADTDRLKRARPYSDQHLDASTMQWIRFQEGRRNRAKSVRASIASFTDGELGLTAFKAVCAALQYKDVLVSGEHGMYLPGTCERGEPAVMTRWREGIDLSIADFSCYPDTDGDYHDIHGTASYRR